MDENIVTSNDVHNTVLLTAKLFGLHHGNNESPRIILITKAWFACLQFYLLYLDCLIIQKVVKYNKAPTYHVSYTFETFEIFNVEFVFVVYQFLWTAALLTSYINWQRLSLDTQTLIHTSRKLAKIPERYNIKEKVQQLLCSSAAWLIIITALGANLYHLQLTASTLGGTLLRFPLNAYRTFLKCLGPTVSECLFLTLIYSAGQTVAELKFELQQESLSTQQLYKIRTKYYEIVQHLYRVQSRFQLELVLILLACGFDVLMNIYSLSYNAYRVLLGPGLQYIDWFVIFNIYQAVQKLAQILMICLPVDNLHRQLASYRTVLKRMSLTCADEDTSKRKEINYFYKQCMQEQNWMFMLGMFPLDKAFAFLLAASLGSYITVLLQFAKGE